MEIRTLGLVCFILSLDLAFSQLACPTGKWGTNCDLTCHANCKLNCERAKGTCYGCKDGWYDSHCDTPCSDCKFGCDQKTGLCECDVYGCQTCKTDAPSECDVCDSTKNFIHNIYAPERCCSDGCGQQVGGVINCKANGTCDLDTCEVTGYWGEKCTKCSETIPHCESCNRPQGTSTLICTQCWSSYEISNDQKRCCPPGCDDCQTLDINDDGKETDVCSVCKSGYYIYGERCDNCGGNCQSPSAGPPEARCDPVDGHCLYGCLSGWHGSKCDVKCELSNCETCQYDEPNKSLTCLTCAEGWAPHPVTGLCEQCNSNCADGRCDQETGYCTLGCSAGWRGDRCDQPCADAGLGNCTVCGRDTMTCSECMFNNWGPICENECSPHCSPEKDLEILNPICVKDTAECRGGCYPGYWREDCRLECPNCLNDTCRITDGKCTENACKSGFWDDNCETPCSPYCALNSATGEQECNFQSGFCTHGCTYNTHGDTCLQPCNPNCYDNRTDAAILANEPLCAQSNGQCMYECKKGFYTYDCSKPCESTCVTDDCGFVEGYCVACDWVPKGQACYDGACPIGKHGQFCQSNCTGGEYCLDEICNRFNGDCEGCITARWGADCEFECPTCTEGMCFQGNGECVLGCVDGTWGQKCKNTCHERCDACDRDNGECVRCEAGKFGTICERNCSENCLPSSDNSTRCSKDAGHCTEEACNSGFYGLTCNSTCNQNCAGNENGTVDCEINTGECSYNCQDGWFGLLCTGQCLDSCRNKRCVGEPDNCVDGCSDFYYGDRCQLLCNEGCKNGKCDDSGVCIERCENGKYGLVCDKDCSEVCIDDACDIDSGRCEYCHNFTADNFHMCVTATCKVGEYGTYCNMTCPGGDMCMNNSCDRYTAICEGCVAGQWGDYCQNNCSTCIDGSCSQETGVCAMGCNDGYFGQTCLDQCDDRCARCERTDGSCLVCSEGFYGPICEHNCSIHCALTDGKLLCDKGNGKCSSGACVPGYFGLKCEDECFDNCLALDGDSVAKCNYSTGYCTNGCIQGYYGLLCTGQCSATCRNQNCRDDSNNCLDGCTDEYWGPLCLQECNRGCNHGQCDDFGVCLAGCKQEWYGPSCNLTCQETCIDDFCDQQTGNCSECTKQQPSKLCRTALCNQGLYGLQCDQPCPSTVCLDNRCNRNNGTCDGCNVGLYGPYCRSECPNCLNGACNQDSGRCMQGCVDGWYGERCDLECDSCVNCSRSTGLCTACSPGKHGDQCQFECSNHCLPDQDGYKTCDIYTAACKSSACVPGFYGYDCATPCHSNCGVNNDSLVLCDFVTGACSANCTNLFYGPHCEKDCESYCHDKTCHRTEGICADCKPIQGCVDCLLPPNCPDAICNTGFWGQTCLDPCPERCDIRGCDRYTARCVDCQPGFYGDKCTNVCTYQGCYTCAQSTGQCESCLAGKYGINCDLDCGGCASVNGEVRCDMVTGNCLTDVCQPGKWGIYCSRNCSKNCADSNGADVCDKLSGECLLGCDHSYFGDQCDQECSLKCKNKNCKEFANDCQEGCAIGYFGLPSCLTECSRNCINKNCDETNGFCNEGCADGYYLDQCDTVCTETCINNKCNRDTGRCLECTQTTNNPYYFCRTKECQAGKRGNMCDKDCHENCAETCDRYTGKCDGCDKNYYGANCTLECRTCIDGLCNQENGECDIGCEAGYFGPNCVESCKFEGCETCDREFGLCLTCKVQNVTGLFGTACEKLCSDHCTASADGYHLCNKDNGVCAEGSCAAEWWGLECNDRCNANCKENNNGDQTCYYRDGTCSSGCKDYFWGDQCDKACSDRCLGSLCDRDSKCLIDCIPGAYGPSCEFDCVQTCNDGTCDRFIGNCTECNKPLDQQTELCRTAPCKEAGKTGVYCNISCPENCESSCNRNTHTCDACQISLWGDNCTRACGNCTDNQCFQNNGTCTKSCEDGFWGSMCRDRCSYTGCYACGRYTGGCTVCKPNLWGDDCDVVCSPACPAAEDENVYCNRLTGACDVGTCAVGFYGNDCTKECSTTCISNVCDFEEGSCTIGCLSGWWNPFCNETCGQFCVENKCTRDGQCDLNLGCVDGYSGFDCSKPCNETCIDGKCDRDLGRCFECTKEPPEDRDYTCRSADCQVGRQGLFCNETCPEHCESSCDRYNSTCDGCNPGFYNDTCDYVCGFCSDVTCNQATGKCDVGCVDRYWGDLCRDECLYPDCKSCSRDDGECDVCVPGKHGKDCSEDCSSACAASSDGKVYCQKDSGVCREGLCSPGWYSADCSLPCPDYCAPIENRGTYCAIDTGSCTDGCLPGWYGDLCDIPCNTNCRDGLCTRSGYCIGGCVENFYGDYCESECGETCNDNMCDRDSGRCEECYVVDRPPTFECRDAACPSGVMGLLCDEPCPPGCQDTCQRYNGTCASCKSGFYGDHCNITCGNCFQEACEQQTGNCYQGCLDEWYGLQCLQSCVDPNCQTCDIITGTCRECKPRHYGFNCAKNCSNFCAPNQGTNVVRCDMETGSCKAEKCKAGHYLKDCSRRCNDTCGADFNGDRPCDLLTGRCQYDCVPGWYGDTCDRRCSQQCAEGLCNRTGFCLGDLDRACQPGYYGGDCRLNCFEPQTCNDGRCHRFNGNCSACDDPPKAPECRDAECPKGTWGLNCDQTCPPNCEGGVCIREVGLCKDCLNTWYGDECDSQCRNCQDDVCFQTNGNCIRNCKDGWYTSTCNTPCLYPGCKDCTRDNGTCVDCQIGKYKDDCSADCSPNCAHTDNGLECIKSSGICKSGQCNTGYWHETCREECSPYCDTDGCELSSGACSPCKLGWFGISCRQKCSANCKNEHCEGTYDNCVEGCKDGFWGPTCDYQCNQNCVQDRCDINTGECSIGCNNDMFYGPTCKESCNSNCATETGTRGGECERSGYCRTDCVNGTYGDMCENACPTLAACTDGTCHRKNGNCSACDAKEPSYLCPSADCKIGMWGINCEKNCSSTTCLYNRCTREDDICVGCPIGLYARKCDKTCGQCKIGTGCNQLSGFCEEGCRDGFQGDKCDQACASNCQSCERYGDPTKCVTCIENTWGPNCEFTCNPNCAKIIEGTRAVTRCEKDTGHCSSGTCREDRFWRYNCSEVCPQNCLPVDGVRTCKIHNGACEGGCQNTYFGTQCTQECSVQCKDKICLNSRNNCVNGCAQGYYSPPTCSGTCSAWCKNPGNVPGQEICDPNTGSCLYKCVDGYFGDRCIEKCYGVCTDGTCDDLGGCPDCRITPVGPKCHPQVCPISPTTGHGTYGPSCESDCPGLYCKNRTCHRQTGKCPQGCQEWFHGEYCTEKCICDRTGTQNCNQEGLCECNPGFTSVDCSQRCSDGCQSNLCDKTGQCTLGCIAGRYGAQCDGRCSNCVDESCNPSTGECSVGCKPGFFGTRCEDACADNCLTCQSDAACTSCVSFRYGLPTCTQTCSAMCKQAASGRVCSESSGACIEGCVNGFYGNQCDKRCDNCGGNAACSTDGECLDGCRPGYFGSKCDVDCSFGCARGGQYNSRECDITSGACTYGCLSGYHGSTCLMCSATCLGGKCSSATVCTDGCEAFYYGKDSGCSRECTNCKNGKCDDEGMCLEGCMDRFYGTKCEKFCAKTCKDDTCDQTSGECADCSSTPVGPLCRDIDAQAAASVAVEEKLSMGAIIGISAGCAGAVVIIVILMVCCVFYRRQATDAKNEIHLPSDVLERLSTHRSHHSTISSQYPVARVVGDDEKDFVLF